MKEPQTIVHKFDSLYDAHRAFDLPKPQHPLVSLLDSSKQRIDFCKIPHNHVLTFYKISYKQELGGKLRYGQGYYDFDEGGLLFAAPGQVMGKDSESTTDCSLYTLLIHPDLLRNYPLGKKIKQYGFFSYSANEALHLSDAEKETIITIFRNIGSELESRIDDFSQDVIVAQIELLLNYANRFYKRQFITRKAVSNETLQKLDEILEGYFDSERTLTEGIITVQSLADSLHVSPSYLSDMLRSLTGQNAQQHIHNKLIEKAKEKLSATSMSVSEIAYELGFEHPQSFSKLFKTKTHQSPLEFRRAFN